MVPEAGPVGVGGLMVVRVVGVGGFGLDAASKISFCAPVIW